MMTALHKERIRREKEGLSDDSRPAGPRVAYQSEEARRLGELITAVKFLTSAVIAASPKTKGGKMAPVKPYPSPVIRDGETGNWTGGSGQSALQRKVEHQRVQDRAKMAAKRYEEKMRKGEG